MEKIPSLEKSCDNVTQDENPVNPDHRGQETSVKKHLVKSAGLMAFLTLCSRVLGMTRDVLSAKIFGTSWQWDSFLYAFSLPNFLRDLVGEGAVSSAFIPVYSELLHQKGKDAAFRFASVTFTVLGCVLALFLLIVELALNICLRFSFLSDRLRLTVELLRYTFPYLWFICLYAIGMGILNSHKRFFSSSFAPIIMNLAWIAGAIIVPPQFAHGLIPQVRWLAIVLLISGALQFAFEVPALLRLGFRFQWIWDFFSVELRKSVYLILPSILGFAVVQVNILVDMTCGFAIGPGANSSLWFGNRVMQFPLGIFAVAIATAVLPTVAQQTASHNLDAAKKTLSFGLRSIFLIVLPSSIGLIALRQPIIQLLFERGQFDAISVARTASVLMCYSFGLFAYSGQKIVVAGFYAVQDTRTPVKIAIVALVTNIALNLILMIPLKESGLALATSISGILQFILLLILFHRKVASWDVRFISISFVKILAASLGMGAVAGYSYALLSNGFIGKGLLHGLAVLSGSISISTLAYLLFCFLFRVHEMRELIDWLSRRKHK